MATITNPMDEFDETKSMLNQFDPDNQDLKFMNSLDQEHIHLAGSPMFIYKSYQSKNFDPVYMESKDKPIALEPIKVWGHYEPRAIERELTEFGLTIENDQIFTFNLDYITRKLGRQLRSGDIIHPEFQNIK